MLMQLDTVLEVDHMSKLYSREQISTRQRLATTFTRALMGRPSRSPKKLKSGEFWSLDDINFTLKSGEALGVIGLNGSGKSTLLRILSGQLLPDKGEIRMLGDVAAMIDLTAGFQMSASGSQNIYLRGAMLGRSKEEMVATYNEIIDFAELGDVINAPVSTYSSGMLMRLAFSIMITAKPDILLIDEVLSVGDFSFKQKCFTRIREMRSYAAFVLVSHSMSDIRLFCDRVIVLNKGSAVFIGDPEEAISVYEDMKFPETDSTVMRNDILSPQYVDKSKFNDLESYWCDADGFKIQTFSTGEDLYFKIIINLTFTPRKLIFGIPVWSEDGCYVTGFTSDRANGLKIERNKKHTFVLRVPNIPLTSGNYISNLSIHDGLEFLSRKENSDFYIANSDKEAWGVVNIKHYWSEL